MAKEKIEVFEKRIDEIQSTVSSSVGIILTAIGVLVTSLALFVSKQVPDAVSNFSPSLIVASIALIVSFLALVNGRRGAFSPQVLGWLVIALGSFHATGILVAAQHFIEETGGGFESGQKDAEGADRKKRMGLVEQRADANWAGHYQFKEAIEREPASQRLGQLVFQIIAVQKT